MSSHRPTSPAGSTPETRDDAVGMRASGPTRGRGGGPAVIPRPGELRPASTSTSARRPGPRPDGADRGAAEDRGEGRHSVTYLKPHGALYNRVVHDPEQARAVVDVALQYRPAAADAARIGRPTAGEERGGSVIREFFADRAYDAEGISFPIGRGFGHLRPRPGGEAGAPAAGDRERDDDRRRTSRSRPTGSASTATLRAPARWRGRPATGAARDEWRPAVRRLARRGAALLVELDDARDGDDRAVLLDPPI